MSNQKKPRWTTADKEFLKENYENLGAKEIGKKIGRSKESVTMQAGKLKLTQKNPPWSKKENELLKKYHNKISSQEISEKINRSPPSIRAQASRLKLTRIRYTKNINFFSRLTVKNCLYAGFIGADGCIGDNYSIKICLAAKDRDFLEAFSSDMDFSGKVYDRDAFSTPGIKHDRSTLSIFDCRKTCSDLYKHFSITPRKTFTLQPPNLTKDCHRAAYIMGYFFGDGCLHLDKLGYYHWSVYGNRQMLIWVKKTLMEWCPNFNDNAVGKKGDRGTFGLNYCGSKAKLVQQTLIEKIGGLHKLPYVMTRKIM